MEKRNNRDQIVIATKYTSGLKTVRNSENIRDVTSYVGNASKSLRVSVEASLKKLRTSYIDILYLHWWDYTTSIEEVMDSLHILVQQGKVLYLGVSDTPAWIVASANRYARERGKTPFVIYQGKWSLMTRDMERDIVPMCVAEGMAIAPWGVLEQGKFRTDAEEEARKESGENGRTAFGDWLRTEVEAKMSRALEKVAQEIGVKSITSVAIAWIMQKVPYVYPIIGGRKVEHLQSNIEALSISLTSAQINELESVVPFKRGFPYDFFGDDESYNMLYSIIGHFDRWPKAEPIGLKSKSQ